MSEVLTIGKYNDISTFIKYDEPREYVIMRYKKALTPEVIDIDYNDYLILYNYLFHNENKNKAINILIAEKFTKVSIQLAINLIKNK